MRRGSSLQFTALAVVVGATIGLNAPLVDAQSLGERLRRAAEEARKALEAKKKAEEAEQQKKGDPPTKPAAPTGPQRPGAKPDAAPPPAASAKPSSATVEADVVSNVQSLRYARISPRGVHLATVVQRGSRWVVTHDGVDGPRFDEILNTEVKFSPDGTRFLYVGRAGEEFVVMVDGKEMTRIPRVDTRFGVLPAFTSNSRHVYFEMYTSSPAEPTHCTLFFDGQPGPKNYGNDYCNKVTISPDGERYLHFVNPHRVPPPGGVQLVLFVDGKPAGYPGAGYQLQPNVYAPQFTADGKHLFVKTMQHTPGQDPTFVVFLDGKPWLRAQDVAVHVPPVGDRVVAVVSAGKGGTSSWHQFLHVDGKKVPGSECPGYGQVHFSPDGKHYAARCQASSAKGHSLVVEGKKGQEYDHIEHVGFTPDSSKAVYVASMGHQRFVVVGDEESDGYMGVHGPDPNALPVAFGSGGKRIGFTAKLPNQTCVAVVDGKATALKPPACATGVAFSPDGSRYAYGQPGGILVVDGAQQTERARIFTVQGGTGPLFVFSPDSKHIAYLATFGSDTSKAAIYIGDGYIPLPAAQVFLPTFTPDGRHFLFASRAGAGHPLGQELVVYVDGRPAARFQGGGQMFPLADGHSTAADPTSSWEMGSDGVLTFLVQDGMDTTAEIKRVRITPPSDTSIDTMLAEARPIRGS